MPWVTPIVASHCVRLYRMTFGLRRPRGREQYHPEARCRDDRHRLPGVHRGRLGARDPDRQRRRPVHHGRPRDDLAGVRHHRRGHRLRARARRRQPHQPRRHPRPRGHRQVPLGRRCPPTSRPRSSGRSSAPAPSSACSARRPSDVGLGVAPYAPGVGAGQAFTAEFIGTFILVFTIFGVIHRKAAAGFAGVAIGLVVFAAIIPVAPATGASINPARTFGPMLVQQIAGGTVKWAQLPVYLAAELLAGVVAALAYAVITRTTRDDTRRHRATDLAPRADRRRPATSPDHDLEPAGDHDEEAHQRPRTTSSPRRCSASRPPTPSFGSTTHNKIIYRGDAPATGQGRHHLRRRVGARAAARRVRRAAACSTPPAPARCSPRRCPTRCSRPPSCVDGGAGVLHIVKNYTGDVMNFEMAAELAAAETGVEVVSVVTDDDVAVQDSTWTAGRRGVGVTVLAGEDRRRGRRGGPRPRRRSPTSPGRSTRTAAAWAWRSPPARCRPPGSPTFELRRGRDGARRRHPRRAGPPARAAGARARDRRDAGRADPGRPAFTGGDGVHRLRQRHGRHAADRALRHVQRGRTRSSTRHGVTVARSLVGSYITSSTWPAARSPCSRSTTSCSRLWDAPVRTPALRWGV